MLPAPSRPSNTPAGIVGAVSGMTCLSCGRRNAGDARLCDQCGAPLADAAAGTARRTVTVLFCDLAGSTAVGDRLDPEALRAVLTAYHARMRAAVERHGGTVEKFIGDAVMAVFGLPDLHEDDALRAVRAAEEMREGLRGLAGKLEAGRGLTLACRIGVNTGEVVVGTGEALVTGDAVNVAARLEQAAGEGEILLGEETELLVRGAVDTAPSRSVEVRGKPAPATAFPLVRVVAGADPMTRRADARLVGRDEELALMRALYDRTVRIRTCHLVTVLGPAGIGKSRLADELAGGVADALILGGRCLPYGEGITYWPLQEALGGRFGDDPEGGIRELLAGDPDAERIARSVGAALGRRPGEGGEEIPWAVRRVLERLAGERPVVLVLDDVQWAEPAFHVLVDHLVGFTRSAPVLVVCLARPELFDTQPDWASGVANAASLLLEPLTAADVRALVGQLADDRVSDGQRARIVDAAEGNPLFAEQLLAVATETGEDDVPLPPTIRALLAARLAGLDPPLQEVLEHAAVEGKVFHLGLLRSSLADRDGADLDVALAELLRRGLVRTATAGFAGETAYAFHHLLTRDVAYEHLSKERRAAVHRRCAEWMAAHGALAEDVRSYHLERVWQLERELDPGGQATAASARAAADALVEAGRHAAERGDASAAASLLGRAVAAGGGADPVWTAVELSYQLMEAGRFDAAGAAIAQLAAMDDGDAVAYADIAAFHLVQNTRPEDDLEVDYRRAVAAAERFGEQGDDRGLARAWLAISQHRAFVGRYEESHQASLEALAAARRAGDHAQVVRVAADLPIALWFGPTPAAEVTAYVRDVIPAMNLGMPVQAEALMVRGVARAAGGEIDAGRADVALGRAWRADLGHRVAWAVTAQLAARVELYDGDLERAEALLAEGSAELVRLRETSFLSTNEGMRALILADLGRRADAREAAETCRRAAAPGDVISQVFWRLTEALLLSGEGDHDHAVGLARAALALGEPTDGLEELGTSHAVLGRVLAAAGDREGARRHLEQAAELHDRKGATAEAGRVRGRLAALDSTG